MIYRVTVNAHLWSNVFIAFKRNSCSTECLDLSVHRSLFFWHKISYFITTCGLSISVALQTLWNCTKNNAQGCSLRLENAPEVAWFPFFDDSSDARWGIPSPDAYYSYAINDTGGVMVSFFSVLYTYKI